MAYNIAPTPQQGSGPYGSVPGLIGLPTNLYNQVNTAIPELKPVGGAAAGVIGSQVNGIVNPDVQNLIQSKAAALTAGNGTGGTVGVPGSFAQNNYLASLGQNSEEQQQTGIDNYMKFLTGVGGTMSNPNLQFEVAQQNAVDAAAPNPAAAAEKQLDEFDKYMSSTRTGGYTGGGGSSIYVQTPGMNSSDRWLNP